MPKKQTVETAGDTTVATEQVAPAAADTITIDHKTLQALIASEVAKATLQRSNDGDSVRVAEAIAQFSANQKAIVETQARKNRSLQEMIAEYPAISAFNPKGDRDFPRPTHFRKVNGLPRVVRINGNNQSDGIDRMTMEEIMAFDAITENCECRNGTWKASVYANGNTEYLDIVLPTADMDKRNEIGAIGLTNILYELRTKGKKLPDVQVALTRMLATTTDPDAFLKNLERLLSQAPPAVPAA